MGFQLKMFNGHRGINHPVKNLISGKVKLRLRITVLQSIRRIRS
jgi:hypothetical protein